MKRHWLRTWLLALAVGVAVLLAQAAPAADTVVLPDGGVVLNTDGGVTPPQTPPPLPPSLKTATVPGPEDLDTLVVSRAALKQLGKALFWDMQVGSDGIQACASCHFHAGTDGRITHQLNPGPNGTFDAAPINGTVTLDDFPFHKRANPDAPTSPPHPTPEVLRDVDDRMSSQGIHPLGFLDVANEAADRSTSIDKGPWQRDGIGVRKVEPRNTPTVINSVFNLRNFWDGRANRFFNGRDPFGDQVSSFILVRNEAGEVVPKTLRLAHSSLASQAVGPPNNSTEMAFDGRSFPKLGKKLMRLIPLVRQEVAEDDSVLGPIRHASGKGLAVSYRTLIRRAFRAELWDAPVKITCNGGCDRFSDLQFSPLEPAEQLGTNQYNLMEYNFALFFGLALQEYQSTLVSDDAPFDRFREGDASALTPEQQLGFSVFMGMGQCANCHRGPEFTSAAFTHLVQEEREKGLVERMPMGDGTLALYDNGFYNIGVRPREEDLGVGGTHPNGRPLSFTRQFVEGQFDDVDGCALEARFDPLNCQQLPSLERRRLERQAVDGAFKTPGLRNVELTGPFMHNGGMATLEQVVDFYNRGADFSHQDPDIRFLGLSVPEKAALVAFLKSLTDERVRHERAPFDHPQLCVPNGHPTPGSHVVDRGDGQATDALLDIAAVGAAGGPALQSFAQILQEGTNRHASGPCTIGLGDTTRPQVTPPTFRVAVGERLGTSGRVVPLDVQWSGTDQGGGVARYELQRRVNGSGWGQVELTGAVTSSVIYRATPGDRLQFRVRAADLAGNKSNWMEGPVLTVGLVQESGPGVSYLGKWVSSTAGSPSGGSLVRTDEAGARATFTFTGQEVALLGARAPGHGRLEVLVDGVSVETLDLAGGTTTHRLVLTGRDFPAGGQHTLTLVSTGGGRVTVDGIVTLR